MMTAEEAARGWLALYDRYRAVASQARTPQEQRRFLLNLASFRTRDEIGRTLDALLTPEIPTQDVAFLLMRLFGNPAGRDDAWKFLRRRWSALRKRIPPLMMTRTREDVARACRREGLRRPRILAVTVLTSLARRDLRLVGVDDDVEDQVVRLARLARRAEMDGVVASPLEIARIRRQAGRGFLIVTPGIRPPTASMDDQKRVLSPGEAMRAGADYLVVGRPIRDAPDPLAVSREVLADMARGVLTSRTRQGTR